MTTAAVNIPIGGFKDVYDVAEVDRALQELSISANDALKSTYEKMIKAGLLDEVASLVEKGYGLDLKPLRSVGYRHMGLVLKDEMSVDEALELMKRDTRRLAKRQLTWFRGEDGIQWYHPNDKEKIVAAMERFLS